MLLPVIMAGGSGSRLWPLSRSLYPKQFLPLVDDDNSMLQATVNRLDGLTDAEPMVICNQDHRFIVAEQMRALNMLGQVLLEPVARNTAPAIALAAFAAQKEEQDPILLVLAADHDVRDTEAFQRVVQQALPAAEQGKLVTFGIVPTEPHTGYGYIQQGAAADEFTFAVNQFVEKPNLATAEKYLAEGTYSWNSGMFMFKASRYLDELKTFSPQMYQACLSAYEKAQIDQDFVRIDEEEFAKCPDDSIDYAVMEQTKDAVVIPMDAGWSDVGSWTSLWQLGDKDENGNVVKSQLEDSVMQIDSHNNLIMNDKRLVATLGIKDCVIVDTQDALLVAHKDNVQQVKDIVNTLKAQGRSEFKNHREVYRPWGKYDSIDTGQRYQVKRITVDAGAKLSVQMHHHRAEHWVVVSGTAKVTNGDKTFLVTEDQSTYIPVGVVHALENPGKVPLEMIEVQSGSYLGEDDIVRFEDIYGRTS